MWPRRKKRCEGCDRTEGCPHLRDEASPCFTWRPPPPGAHLTGAQHRQMLAFRDGVARELAAALDEHGPSPRDLADHVYEWVLYALPLTWPYTVWRSDVGGDEAMAAGHIDYASKFPLYVAQRAWGVR